MIRDAPDPTLAALDRHPGGRPQVADRGRRSRCFSAPGSQRAPAALARRVTAADSICSVVPAGAELRDVELFGGSTAGAPTLASCAPHTQHSPRARPTKRAHDHLPLRHPPDEAQPVRSRREDARSAQLCLVRPSNRRVASHLRTSHLPPHCHCRGRADATPGPAHLTRARPTRLGPTRTRREGAGRAIAGLPAGS